MNLFELAAVLTLDRSQYDSGLNDAQKTAEGFGSKLKGGLATAAKAGAVAISAASTAVVAFGKSSVDAGMTFDSSMSQVAATMGTTVDQIQDLRDFAREMGAKTAFSANEAADALNYMALAGYDAETSMSMLPNVLNLAAAGGIDLAYASDMITDSQSALGLTLDETTELVDKMAKASSKSNTSVSQLGEAILTVGGTAKTLAGGTTELATALGIIADNGVKGAEGGTALRNIILSLSAPTDTAAKTMKKLGLEVFDAEGNMRPLNETFSDLDKALSTMTQGEQTQVLNKIFNKVDLKSVNALLANVASGTEAISYAVQASGVEWEKYSDKVWMANRGLEGFADDLQYALSQSENVEDLADFLHFDYDLDMDDAMATAEAAFATLGDRWTELSGYIDDAAGAAQAMADTQLDNLAGDITKFQSALGDAKIEISDQLKPALREFVQFGTDGVGRLTDAFKKGGLTGAMDALGGVLSDGIAMITDMLPDVVNAGVGLITAFVDGITSNIEPITNAALKVGMELIGGISKVLPKLIKAGLDIVKTLIKGISSNAKSITETITGTVIETAKALTDPTTLGDIVNAGVELINNLIEGIREAIPQIKEAVPVIIQNISQFLTDSLPDIVKAGLDLIIALGQGFLEALPTLIEQLPTIIDGVLSALTESIPLIIDAGIQLFTALVKALPEIITKITEALPKIITSIITAVMELMPQIMEAGITLISALVDNLPAIISALQLAVPKIIAGLVEAFQDPETCDRIIEAGIKLFTTMVENTAMLVDIVVTIVPKIIAGLFNAFSGDESIQKMGDAGKNIITGLWNGLESMGEWLGDNIFGFFDNMVNGIKDMLGIHSPSTVFADVGKNIVGGVWEGIKNMKDTLWNNVSNFFGGIVNGVKNMLGIHSPSTVFAEMGENMALGIGKGFDNEFASIRDDMNDQMDFTANAEVNVSKRGVMTGGYGMGAEITSSEKQPLTVIVQLSSGVELGRALIENINQAKRVDGLVY